MGKRQWFWGALFIALGVILLLNNFGVTSISIGKLFSDYWPVILIYWGLSTVVARKNNGDLVLGSLLALLGLLVLGNNLNLIEFDFSLVWASIWPALLILAGINLLLGTRGGGKTNWAIMGSVDKTKASWKLENDNYLAVMGGIVLDLSKAVIEQEEYTLNCTALMGGIEIRVPQYINVICEGNAILGGIECFNEESGGIYGSVKTERRVEQANTTLHIVGRAVMGGIEIKAS
ncbi:MAG TPA: cell wall-active antibiotics response protein [Clostridia bacterium]|jgi:predicted membrane protein|nr:cell wall-active antibiotics response protein [Clostridia bacterium]